MNDFCDELHKDFANENAYLACIFVLLIQTACRTLFFFNDVRFFGTAINNYINILIRFNKCLTVNVGIAPCFNHFVIFSVLNTNFFVTVL